MDTASGELGPNSEDVEQFMARLHGLSEGQLLRMAAFGDRAQKSEHHSTYASIGRRVKAAGRQPAVEHGRDQLMRWLAWPEELALPGYIMGVESLISDARREALPAAYDAMVACVARDLLAADEFEFLIAPWREVSGQESEV